jgi:hypothetical protein
MRKAKVEVLISADEMFTKFHESCDKVLVPLGTKRVGSSVKIDNEKAGCTSVVSMEMMSGQLLPPFLVHKGTFGGTLMKKWRTHTSSTVVFTVTHWMTEETAILYLQMVVRLYPEKNVGIVWDKHSLHMSERIGKWIEEHNDRMEQEGSRSRLVMDFVDNCLTGIYQPCDVVVMRVIERIICRKYHEMLGKRIDNGSIAPGDTLRITREDVTRWMEEAVEEVNEEQADKDFYISNTFQKCGLDFRVKDWDKETPEEFKKHLDSLHEE